MASVLRFVKYNHSYLLFNGVYFTSCGLILARHSKLRYDEDEKIARNSKIKFRYTYFVAGLMATPIILCCYAGAWVSRKRNLPLAPLLKKALEAGTTLGSTAALSYVAAKEISSREWFAMLTSGTLSGMVYGWLHGLSGTKNIVWIKYGAIIGFSGFMLYSFLLFSVEICKYFLRNDVTKTEWHEFSIQEYISNRIATFLNLEDWIAHFYAKAIRELVIDIRIEMDELEQLLDQAGISQDECEHVNWSKVSDDMFDILGQIKTGRHQFDKISQHTTTATGTLIGKLDPSPINI